MDNIDIVIPDNKNQDSILKTESTRLNASEWNMIETKANNFNEIERLVQASLIKLGNSEDATVADELITVIGDKFYYKIRHLLNDFNKQPQTKKNIKEHQGLVIGEIEYEEKTNIKQKGGKKPKGKSADEIRFENTIKTIEKVIIDILSTFSIEEMSYTHGITNKLLEARGITLMYCAWIILYGQPELYKKPKKIEEIYEVIIGIQKFIKSTTNYKGKSLINSMETLEFSNLLLVDLERWLIKLTETYPIDGYNLYTNAPKLLFFCKFDDARPGRGIVPRQSQKEVMKYIQENPNGHLILYKAMVNSGKTTFAGSALASYVKKYRISHQESKLQALFCCGVENVCYDVASVAYANNIKFGFANIEDNNIKIINSYLCAKDDERILIIAGLDATIKLLSDDKKRMDNEKQKNPDITPKSNYILFHDELTADSDYLESEVLLKNMQILKLCPDKTILSSATLPDVNQLTEFLKVYTDRYPQLINNIFTVISNEIHSACDMYSYDGEYIIPHFGCKTINQLKKAYDVINNVPFLGRLYTPLVVKKMWDKMQELNLQGLPDLKTIFSDTNNMKPDMIRKVAMNMLECLINSNRDDLVNKICSFITFEPIIEVKEKKEQKEDEDGIIWATEDAEEDEEPYNSTKIRLDKLADKDAHKIAGGITLITSSNPIEFTLKTFNGFLELLEKQGYDSVKKIIQSYEKEMDTYNEQIKRLEERVKNDDLRSQKIQQLQQSLPSINFPSIYQINTKKHILKFASKHKHLINKQNIRGEFPPEKHPNNFSIDEKLKLLLWCGIAVYNPNTSGNNTIDRFYTNYVHQLMSSNQLAIVVSNKKIMYGSNYPIRTVIPDDEFSEKHSMNSLFQLFGRAGRVGLAYRATVYISNTLSKRLYDFIHVEYGTNSIEVNNMNTIIKKLIKEENDLLIARQEKEKLDAINKQKKELEKLKSLQVKLSTINDSQKGYNSTNVTNSYIRTENTYSNSYKDQNSYTPKDQYSYTPKDQNSYTPKDQYSYTPKDQYSYANVTNSYIRKGNDQNRTQQPPSESDTSSNWRSENNQQVISKQDTSNDWRTKQVSNEKDIYRPPMSRPFISRPFISRPNVSRPNMYQQNQKVYK